MPREERTESRERARTAPRKKTQGSTKTLKSVAAAAPSAEAILDLVERLGVADLVMTTFRSRIQEIDLDDLVDEGAAYLRRNPEALVVSLGAATIAAAMLVWINNRREWDGSERRSYYSTRGDGDVEEEVVVQTERKQPRSGSSETASSGRARRAS